jgi:hypothetical protein
MAASPAAYLAVRFSYRKYNCKRAVPRPAAMGLARVAPTTEWSVCVVQMRAC